MSKDKLNKAREGGDGGRLTADQIADVDRGSTYLFRVDDRRKRPTKLFSKYMFIGRRRETRRGLDGRGYYVDQVKRPFIIAGLLIIALSISDAILTLACLRYGLEEANPAMAVVIGLGPFAFLLIKVALTTAGAVILMLHQNFRFGKAALYGAVITFALINLNNLRLLIKAISQS